MPKANIDRPKFSRQDLADAFVMAGIFVGGLLAFGYSLYALYHFLPVWFGGFLTVVFFTPFVIFFVVICVKLGMLAGVAVGACLYLIYAYTVRFCTFCQRLAAKPTAKPMPKNTKPANTQSISRTAKQNIELAVGLMVMGCTAALMAAAVLTSVPKDVLFCAWLILLAVIGLMGNHQLKKQAR